ncbi:hypothetical protein OBBRIDRAFT_525559 [Obba rivulosa]|uniref:Uncharacterized protein n=1 Tax=Obba rivulosa TaxID=1052685 RepID=A0A8E2B4F9_9APHY|nr:hypothetical protein OBBRIDRAFT_525559 [Obba rivulosa]
MAKTPIHVPNFRIMAPGTTATTQHSGQFLTTWCLRLLPISEQYRLHLLQWSGLSVMSKIQLLHIPHRRARFKIVAHTSWQVSLMLAALFQSLFPTTMRQVSERKCWIRRFSRMHRMYQVNILIWFHWPLDKCLARSTLLFPRGQMASSIPLTSWFS